MTGTTFSDTRTQRRRDSSLSILSATFLINFLKNILLKTIDKHKWYRYNGTQFTNKRSEIRVEKWTRNGKFMRCTVQIAGKSYMGIRIKAGV